jgi:hypothetical protein
MTSKLNISEEALARKLIGFASDGASVMVGVQNGVATRLRNEYAPRVVNVHCFAHCTQVHLCHCMVVAIPKPSLFSLALTANGPVKC